MSDDAIAWIAADWGTSNLRCRALSGAERLLDEKESAMGMQAVSQGGGDFESALLDLIEPWLPHDGILPVLACGMVGARQGWVEVPYVETPCSPRTPALPVATRDRRIAVSIRAGVRQSAPADVMRGEETQIAGLLAQDPGFEGLICLPGTHTKWVTVRDGRILRFRTFMTGEVFALLAQQSILRLTLSDAGLDREAFEGALRQALQSPASLLADAFQLRAEALLENLDGIAARSRLSGLLIGQELAGMMSHGMETSGTIPLIGASPLPQLYRLALGILGKDASVSAAEEMVIAGLAGHDVAT